MNEIDKRFLGIKSTSLGSQKQLSDSYTLPKLVTKPIDDVDFTFT